MDVAEEIAVAANRVFAEELSSRGVVVPGAVEAKPNLGIKLATSKATDLLNDETAAKTTNATPATAASLTTPTED